MHLLFHQSQWPAIWCNVLNDAIGKLPININWNVVWDVAVDINEEGWFVRCAFLFSSIPFQVKDEIVMGLICSRYIARKKKKKKKKKKKHDLSCDQQRLWRVECVKPSLGPGSQNGWRQTQKPFYIAPCDRRIAYHAGYELQSHRLWFQNNPYLRCRIGCPGGIDFQLKSGLTFKYRFCAGRSWWWKQVNRPVQSFLSGKATVFQERSGIFNYNFGAGGLFILQPPHWSGQRRSSAYIRWGPDRRKDGNLDVGALKHADGSSGFPWTSVPESLSRQAFQTHHQQSVRRRLLVTNQMTLKGNFNTTYRTGFQVIGLPNWTSSIFAGHKPSSQN